MAETEEKPMEKKSEAEKPGKKTNSKKKSKQEKKVERQLIKIGLFFIALVLIFFVASWVFEEMSKIEYEGLTFTKEKFGQLTFYHYYYYFTGEDGQINRYNLYLRNDPRHNNVPVYGDAPVIFEGALGQSSRIMLTIDTPSALNQCPQSFGSIGLLSSFISDNGFEIRSGVMNEEEAERENVDYITCENQANKTNVETIQIVSGNETRIDVSQKCHTITIGPDCEVLKAVEKFMTQAVLDARANP